MALAPPQPKLVSEYFEQIFVNSLEKSEIKKTQKIVQFRKLFIRTMNSVLLIFYPLPKKINTKWKNKY